MLRHSLRLSLLASALLLLPACGGGGGGSAANEQTETFTLTELLPEGYSYGDFGVTFSTTTSSGHAANLSLSFRINRGNGNGGSGTGEIVGASLNYEPEGWNLTNGSGTWTICAEGGIGITINIENSSSSDTKIVGNNDLKMEIRDIWPVGNTIHCTGQLRDSSSISVAKGSESAKCVVLDGASFEYIIYP